MPWNIVIENDYHNSSKWKGKSQLVKHKPFEPKEPNCSWKIAWRSQNISRCLIIPGNPSTCVFSSIWLYRWHMVIVTRESGIKMRLRKVGSTCGYYRCSCEDALPDSPYLSHYTVTRLRDSQTSTHMLLFSGYLLFVNSRSTCGIGHYVSLIIWDLHLMV